MKKIAYLLSVGIILTLVGCGSTPTPSSSTTTTAPISKNKPTMTKAEFDQIKDGMSYAEVTAIVGGPGELQAESGKAGDADHTVSYMYKGDGAIGANASLMFQGEKMNMKAQAGLK